MGDSQPRRLEEQFARELGRILVLAALAMLQVTLLTTPLGFAAPLLLVLVVARTLLGVGAAFPDIGLSRALRWALYGGLTLDVLSATPLGVHALALLLAALAVATLSRRLRIERLIVPLGSIIAAALIYETVLGLLTQPERIDWPSYALVVMLPTLLAALVMILPTQLALRWLLREQL